MIQKPHPLRGLIMSQLLTKFKATYALGLCVALLVGFIAGGLLRGRFDTGPTFEVPVFASATQGHDNFVIATGLVDDGVEALFFLDFLTGDLKATVVNERNRGFNAFFEYNIADDFNLSAVRNPKYLMVTGIARNLNTPGVGGQVGDTVLYVVEATTGQLVAYVLPWNSGFQSAGKTQRGTFIPLARTELRTTFVRDQ